jgi:hypothetical protein
VLPGKNLWKEKILGIGALTQACLVYACRMVSHERVEPLLVGTGA